MPLVITDRYTGGFRRLSTSGNTSAKLADNEIVSTGFWYSSNPLQDIKGMSSSSSVAHDRTDAYKASVFYRFVASPPPVGNKTLSFLLIYFSSPSVSTVLPSSDILDGYLLIPKCWPWIWRWWITFFFGSTVIFLLPLSLMLSCFSWIATGNESGSPSDFLGTSLTLCVTIISSLKWYPRSLLTKAFLSVIFEALIVCMNGHENILLHAIPSSRVMETFIYFSFNTKGFL